MVAPMPLSALGSAGLQEAPGAAGAVGTVTAMVGPAARRASTNSGATTRRTIAPCAVVMPSKARLDFRRGPCYAATPHEFLGARAGAGIATAKPRASSASPAPGLQGLKGRFTGNSPPSNCHHRGCPLSWLPTFMDRSPVMTPTRISGLTLAVVVAATLAACGKQPEKAVENTAEKVAAEAKAKAEAAAEAVAAKAK